MNEGDTVELFRPVGPAELALIEESDFAIGPIEVVAEFGTRP